MRYLLEHDNTKYAITYLWIRIIIIIIITALHWMQAGLVARKVSNSQSVKRVNCDKTEEKYMCPDFYTARKTI